MSDQRVNVLQRVDDAVYRVERWAAGFLFLAMSLVMFVSVMHRIFSRPEGKVGAIILALVPGVGPEAAYGRLSTVAHVVLTFGMAYGALRTMKNPLGRPKALGGALVLTVALAALVKVILAVFPNGLVWGPAVAMSCMLWVGIIGASLATREKRHLALEMGEKIWPAKVAPYVKAIALGTAATMCLFLLLISILSIQDHYSGWAVNHLTGTLQPTNIPRWAVFLIFPYGFLVMTVRFLSQGAGAAMRPAEVNSEEPA